MNPGAFRKVAAISGVNLRRFLREKSNIFFVFIFPIALILVIGTTFGTGFAPKIGVVAGDDALSVGLVERLSAQPGIEIVEIDDEATLVERVESGSVAAGLVLPPDYGDALEAGRSVEVGFVARPEGEGPQLRVPVSAAIGAQSEVLRAASFVAGEDGVTLGEALDRVEAAAAGVGAVTIEVERVGEALFGDSVGQFDLGAPSQLVLFAFLTGLTASAALIQSRQLGVSRRMLSTPTSTTAIVTGEAGGRFAVVLFQGLYIMVATAIVFGVDWGDPIAAGVLLVVFSLVGAGAGLLMGAVFANDQQAGGIGVLLGLGLAALGGCMVPIEVFSDTMQQVAHLTPHAWALDGYSELVRHGGGLTDIATELAVLAGFAAVLVGLAAWRLRVSLTRA